MTCADCGAVTPETTSNRCRACYLRSKRPAERITHAALMVNGELWSLPAPARHNHLARAWCQSHWVNGGPTPLPDHESGFVTSSGRYVDRVEARAIATAAGQLLPRESGLRDLYSEDVW